MQNYKSKLKNRQPSIETRIITSIGKGIWSLITLPFRKKKSGDIAVRWKEVQELMQGVDSHAWAMAIVKADNILDSVLIARLNEPRQVSRDRTMGERLRNIESRISREALQSAWDGHKVRNHIAHGDGEISKTQAQEAIAKFRKVLNELNEL